MIRTIRPTVAALMVLLAAGFAHADTVTKVLQTPGVV
jgi:hypothetical protein